MRFANIGVLALSLFLLTTSATPEKPHHFCGANAKITPVEGRPGWFVVETPHGPRLVSHAPGPAIDAAPDFVIQAQDNTWDADGSATTAVDTLVVPLNSTVRWHLATGIHTVTNGKDDLDPKAGTRFDFLLDEAHPDFDLTLAVPETLDYFCAFHLPTMVGTVIVQNTETPTVETSLGALKRRYEGR